MYAGGAGAILPEQDHVEAQLPLPPEAGRDRHHEEAAGPPRQAGLCRRRDEGHRRRAVGEDALRHRHRARARCAPTTSSASATTSPPTSRRFSVPTGRRICLPAARWTFRSSEARPGTAAEAMPRTNISSSKAPDGSTAWPAPRNPSPRSSTTSRDSMMLPLIQISDLTKTYVVGDRQGARAPQGVARDQGRASS